MAKYINTTIIITKLDMGVESCFCHTFVTKLNEAFDAGIKPIIFAAGPLVHMKPRFGVVVTLIERLGNRLRFSLTGEAELKVKWTK